VGLPDQTEPVPHDYGLFFFFHKATAYAPQGLRVFDRHFAPSVITILSYDRHESRFSDFFFFRSLSGALEASNRLPFFESVIFEVVFSSL